MTQQEVEKFRRQFKDLTDNDPFPWQQALYERFVSNGANNIPPSCNLPTGLGKTSVVAIWLLALIHRPTKIPRRLVYVVNRRTVVDQTTTEVERLRENLPKLQAPLQQLAISTLRGQFADNREWSADPSRPAVICGTVDMIGSRLLFSGYGVGFKGRPLHAGFLGQDTLVVHDEAHLEPAFQNLLVAVEREQRSGRFPDRHPIRVMELSATSRCETDESPFELTRPEKDATKESPGVLGVVGSRLRAMKQLHLHTQTTTTAGVQLAKIAIDQFKDSGGAILVFTRLIDDVKTIVDALRKAKLLVDQLIGPMRGLERDRLTNPRDESGSPIFARFLPPPSADAPESERWKVTPTPGTVYLVCTSAGEVGINISGDHLVCDLSTFESMAQRFGRVNRFGQRDDTRIEVVHPEMFDEKDKLTPARRKTLDLLRKLDGNASPQSLDRLDGTARADAFAPLPLILPTSDILFDAWSMTSIRDRMPGRPPVEPYLHGIRDYEPPETRVAWREEVGVIKGSLREEYPPEELLEAYPLKPHELLRDRTDRVWKELVKVAERHPELPAWIVEEQGYVTVLPNLKELMSWDRKEAESRLGNTTVLLPHDIGGLTERGMLNSDFPQSAKPGETPVQINDDVADRWSDDTGPLRLRCWMTQDEDPAPPAGMKLVCQIQWSDPADEEADPTKSWCWFVRVLATDADARSNAPYGLDPHLRDAKDAALQFASGLSIDPLLRDAVIVAAESHDLGKDRDRWQRGIGNDNYPSVKWAKSGKRRGRIERSPYRHESGSVLDVQDRPEFKILSEDTRDVILHLIAAHHGRARPHFTRAETIDEKYLADATGSHQIEATRRFARLQRNFGRWGLAYLESLIRAADYAASISADTVKEGRAR
ncbi:MAG TPA: type I-U CRISPR-associated helicase/endonuclease Cas3 [Humisphaera sp.]|nr:type I-U CRISPR-associated helicase/endonuclease Cas3 [Humisphaera sp.]